MGQMGTWEELDSMYEAETAAVDELAVRYLIAHDDAGGSYEWGLNAHTGTALQIGEEAFTIEQLMRLAVMGARAWASACSDFEPVTLAVVEREGREDRGYLLNLDDEATDLVSEYLGRRTGR